MAGFLEALWAMPVRAVGKRDGDQATNVRTVVGNSALCTTIYSYALDDDGGMRKGYDNREMVAERLALLWNANLGVSNAELRRQAEARR